MYTHTHIFLVYYTPEPYSTRMVKDPVVHGALTISIGYSGIVSHKYQRSPKEQYQPFKASFKGGYKGSIIRFYNRVPFQGLKGAIRDL